MSIVQQILQHSWWWLVTLLLKYNARNWLMTHTSMRGHYIDASGLEIGSFNFFKVFNVYLKLINKHIMLWIIKRLLQLHRNLCSMGIASYGPSHTVQAVQKKAQKVDCTQTLHKTYNVVHPLDLGAIGAQLCNPCVRPTDQGARHTSVLDDSNQCNRIKCSRIKLIDIRDQCNICNWRQSRRIN